jgi:CheY-like chemotaxis protein
MRSISSSEVQEQPAEGSPARRLRVLVVDDYDDIVETMATLLRLYGHEVDTALSGPAALRAAQANPPDVVLLDITMPGMSGYDVAAQLRGMFGYKLLLIAITAYGSAEARRCCLEAGFDVHFVKPVNPDQVERVLRHLADSFQTGIRETARL